MLPEEDMMLKVDGHLVAQHDIYYRHQLTFNGNRHIQHLEWPLGIVQFRLRYRIPKYAITILFILIGRNICALRWRCSIWCLLWRWWRLACLHHCTTDPTKLDAISNLTATVGTNHS